MDANINEKGDEVMNDSNGQSDKDRSHSTITYGMNGFGQLVPMNGNQMSFGPQYGYYPMDQSMGYSHYYPMQAIQPSAPPMIPMMGPPMPSMPSMASMTSMPSMASMTSMFPSIQMKASSHQCPYCSAPNASIPGQMSSHSMPTNVNDLSEEKPFVASNPSVIQNLITTHSTPNYWQNVVQNGSKVTSPSKSEPKLSSPSQSESKLSSPLQSEPKLSSPPSPLKAVGLRLAKE